MEFPVAGREIWQKDYTSHFSPLNLFSTRHIFFQARIFLDLCTICHARISHQMVHSTFSTPSLVIIFHTPNRYNSLTVLTNHAPTCYNIHHQSLQITMPPFPLHSTTTIFPITPNWIPILGQRRQLLCVGVCVSVFYSQGLLLLNTCAKNVYISLRWLPFNY